MKRFVIPAFCAAAIAALVAITVGWLPAASAASTEPCAMATVVAPDAHAPPAAASVAVDDGVVLRNPNLEKLFKYMAGLAKPEHAIWHPQKAKSSLNITAGTGAAASTLRINCANNNWRHPILN